MSDALVLVVLALLLVCSGAISASETALFSLGRRERERAGPLAVRLLETPRELLVSLLLANLVVNILYFAFADRLTTEGGLSSWVGGVAALVPLLLFGEVLPKSLGLSARVPVARACAPLARLVVHALAPARRVLVRTLESAGRVVAPRDEGELSTEELAGALERAGSAGLLHGAEADMLSEVVELRSIRVREIMTPRVDALWLERDGTNLATVVDAALARRLAWLPVVDGGPDAVVGTVVVRDLLLHPERPIDELVAPVPFVPEVASALHLLRLFRERGTSEAVCVDEWGGSAGVVTIEQVFEEIVGDLRSEGESKEEYAVVPLGEGRFRVPGGYSVRDWNEHFGQRVLPVEFETVGGLVAALLGRIPRSGDEVRLGELELKVHAVRGRRVLAVDVGTARRAEEGLRP